MQKQSNNNGFRDSSALNSKLSEVISDILDDETLPILQNKIIDIIDSRYGDSIEENLRNDDRFSNLFENRKAAANFANYTNHPIKSVQQCPQTEIKYRIVRRTVECINKCTRKRVESKTKKVLKYSRQQTKNTNVHKNTHIYSPFNLNSRKDTVEDANKSVVALIPKHMVQLNKENEIGCLNMKDKLNLKFASENLSKKKQCILENVPRTNEHIQKPNLQNMNNFTSKNVHCTIQTSWDRTIPLKQNLINNQMNTIQLTKDTSNIIKVKKPKHIIQNKVESSRMTNFDDYSEGNKYLPCSFYQHLKMERKLIKIDNATPKEKSYREDGVFYKNQLANISRRKSQERSRKKYKMETEFCEDTIYKKNWEKTVEEIPTIKTHCMKKLERTVLSYETKPNYKNPSIDDTKNKIEVPLKVTKKSVLNVEKISSPDIANESKYNKSEEMKQVLENIHCFSVSPNSNVTAEDRNIKIENIKLGNKLNEEVGDTTFEVQDIKINEEIIPISTTNISPEEVGCISTAIEQVHKKNVANLEISQPELSEALTNVDVIDANSIKFNKQNEKKNVGTLEICEQDITKTAVNGEEKYKLKEINLNYKQDLTSKNEKRIMQCWEGRLQKPVTIIKDKAEDISNIEENNLRTTPTYKNAIEYVKIPSDVEENSNEIMINNSDSTEEVNLEVQNKFQLVEFFKPNNHSLNITNINDTSNSQINSNIERKITIYSGVISNKESTKTSQTYMNENQTKSYITSDLGRKILLRVVYKKENIQKCAVPSIEDDKPSISNEIIREKSNEVNFNTPADQKFKSNEIKNTRKSRQEVGAMKYNLRSSTSDTNMIMQEITFENEPSNRKRKLNAIECRTTEELEGVHDYAVNSSMEYDSNSSTSMPKKKQKLYYGQTEIVTRSRAVNL